MNSNELYPAQLAEREDEALRARRTQAATEKPSTAPRENCVGLALSGGGIRSATFSLGLIQGLAQTDLLRHIDFLSTVSGGGYVGSFLGRLFTRSEAELRGASARTGTAAGVPRLVDEVLKDPQSKPIGWLRENGRYLSPNGSGDLLLGVAVSIRNWISLHIVLAGFVLLVFLCGHLVRFHLGMDALFMRLVETAFGTSVTQGYLLWWSPYILLPAALTLAFVIPLGWTYWLIRVTDSTVRQFRESAPFFTFVTTWLPWIVHVFVIVLCAVVVLSNAVFRPVFVGVAAMAVLAAVYYCFAWLYCSCCVWRHKSLPSGSAKRGAATTGEEWDPGDKSSFARHLLSARLRDALGVTIALLLFALVDTLGQTVYAVAKSGSTTVLTVFVALGSLITTIALFSQKLMALLSGTTDGRRLRIPASMLLYLVAFALVAIQLTSVSALGHGIAWGWKTPTGDPGTAIGRRLAAPGPAAVQWRLEEADDQDQLVVVAEQPPPERRGAAVVEKSMSGRWLWSCAAVLLVLAFCWGRVWTFLNRSTYHALYGARLTRAYLGASNPLRWWGKDAAVTRVIPGDGITITDYKPYLAGGPIHLVNVTVNETVSGKSQIEQKDRKGLAMAISHLGISVGRRHHALWNPMGWLTPTHEDGNSYQVFSGSEIIPEPLSLDKSVAISGAAFSTGVGARTSLGLSLLCGMFNVRLGYWWISGVAPRTRKHEVKLTAAKSFGRWFASIFPVQMYLLDEFTARFHGPARREWYLSDGGHFENLATYELIRRRVPMIILSDAEQDEAYTYEGLANLVRKARSDFDAEIHFLGEEELEKCQLPDSVRWHFGTLEQLRRGKWADEPVADRRQHPPSKDRRRLSLQNVDPANYSLAHAALAEVTYLDSNEKSVIVYIKPTIVGDEPVDVLQYHTRHPAFPHEPTSDQFFDEGQWESYRRLGEHIARKLFRPAQDGSPGCWTPHAATLAGSPLKLR